MVWLYGGGGINQCIHDRTCRKDVCWFCVCLKKTSLRRSEDTEDRAEAGASEDRGISLCDHTSSCSC